MIRTLSQNVINLTKINLVFKFWQIINSLALNTFLSVIATNEGIVFLSNLPNNLPNLIDKFPNGKQVKVNVSILCVSCLSTTPDCHFPTKRTVYSVVVSSGNFVNN